MQPSGAGKGPERFSDEREHYTHSKSSSSTKNFDHTSCRSPSSRREYDELEEDDVTRAINALEIEAQIGEKINLRQGGNINWDTEIQVEINDPNSPLYSKCSDFKELNLPKNLIKGLDAMGYFKPSYIQETTLPMLTSNPPRNLIAQSQSGTGKTAAFCLGILTRVTDASYPQAICVSPTRELTDQTYNVIKMMAKYLTVQSVLALPSVSRLPRDHKVREQVIIGTAGTIQMWISKKFFDPSKIIILVFDEADQMLIGSSRIDSMKIKSKCTRLQQVLLFSATFGEEVCEFASDVVGKSANRVLLKPKEITVKKIRQYRMDCGSSNGRFQALKILYECLTLGSVIIFVNTTEAAQSLARRMSEEGHAVSVIYGKLEGLERKRVMQQFRTGQTRVLISTNLLARGIDVEHVNVVINYDIPWDYELRKPDPENYVHRIGRCGRFGRRGLAINFVYDQKSKEDLEEICRCTNSQMIDVPMDDEEIERHMQL
ncbi:uncharacterized protein LOC135145651 isoform X1 [Zophobas morio]|jgi:ATP-dependent RNA helicase DDX19/DBP5|uniref:uncharacterized protein LOC135145651 isoform X1 n=1 Tax=Zophobas morio TaxID=2755281 RepID=UPI0030831835